MRGPVLPLPEVGDDLFDRQAATFPQVDQQLEVVRRRERQPGQARRPAGAREPHLGLARPRPIGVGEPYPVLGARVRPGAGDEPRPLAVGKQCGDGVEEAKTLLHLFPASRRRRPQERHRLAQQQRGDPGGEPEVLTRQPVGDPAGVEPGQGPERYGARHVVSHGRRRRGLGDGSGADGDAGVAVVRHAHGVRPDGGRHLGVVPQSLVQALVADGNGGERGERRAQVGRAGHPPAGGVGQVCPVAHGDPEYARADRPRATGAGNQGRSRSRSRFRAGRAASPARERVQRGVTDGGPGQGGGARPAGPRWWRTGTEAAKNAVVVGPAEVRVARALHRVVIRGAGLLAVDRPASRDPPGASGRVHRGPPPWLVGW